MVLENFSGLRTSLRGQKWIDGGYNNCIANTLEFVSWQVFDNLILYTVYPKKYAHGFCFAVLCCGYTLTDFPISIRLTSLALWQSNDCPSASKATLMNMDKYFMWIHYERLHNHNKAKHNKTVRVFLGIYCTRQHRSLHPRLEVIRIWFVHMIIWVLISGTMWPFSLLI